MSNIETKVFILTRTLDGDVVIDGVFKTEKKAIEYRNQQLKDFGVKIKDWENGDSEYDFVIHEEILQ